VGERAAAMLTWLHALADGEGELPDVGDDAEDRFLRVPYFDRRRAADVSSRLTALLEGTPTLEPAAAPAPPSASRALPESGYVVLRGESAAGPARIVLDAGGLGLGSLAAHGHADALALTVDVGGEPLLRDSGTGSYLPDAGRDRFRVSAAHNTVSIDGESQAEPAGPHIWGRRFIAELEALDLDGDVDYVRATHDGYRARSARALHVRSVTYVKPDLVLVLDRVTAEHPCMVELVWQTPPGRSLDGALTVASSTSMSRRDEHGPFSERFTWVSSAPRTVFRTTGRDVVFATAIALSGEAPPAVHVEHAATQTAVRTRDLRIVERWSDGPPDVERA
jgi:hypothetical protein